MASGMFDDLLNSESEIADGLENEAIEVVRENDNLLIDMNTDQLRQGKDSFGDTLSPQYYSDEYAYMKQRMNSRPGFGVPDLFLEGDFQEGFFLETTDDGWKIDSKDEKRNLLASKYGEEIFGNTEQAEKEFNEEYILPELTEWIMKQMNEKL